MSFTMKAGTETGSLINHIMSGGQQGAPKVGDGATILHWTDRTAGTVIKVSRSGKTFIVQEDTATRVDDRGMSECQTYEYTPNPNGRTWVCRLTKRGYKSGGCGVRLGARDRYHDYSF